MSMRLLDRYTSMFIWLSLVSASVSLAQVYVAPSDSAVHGRYTLDIVAKTGDVIAGQTLGLILDPAINDPGEIAFVAYCAPGQLGIFTLSRVVALVNAEIGGKTLTGFGGIAINNHGSMAFQGGTMRPGFIFEDGVYSTSRLLATAGTVIGGKTLIGAYSPVINERGTVVFHGVYAGGQGIFTPSELLLKVGDVVGWQGVDDNRCVPVSE